MRTNDLSSTPSANVLNENMYKKFGVRINFDKYTREELENYRNLLRTKIHTTETSANFNELLANETYQKDKYVIGVLNQKIKEMLGESKEVISEKSKTEKQARTMAAAAHDPKFAKKVGIKQSVAKEFNKADKGTKKLSNAMKHKKNTKESTEETTMNIRTMEAKKAKKDYDGDGKIESPKDEVWGSRAKAAAKAGHPFKEEMKVGDSKKSSTGGTITKTKTGVKHTAGNQYSGKAAEKEEKKVKEEMKVGDKKKSSTGGTIEKTKTGIKHTAGNNYGAMKQPFDKDDAPKKKKVKESGHRQNVKIVIEALSRYLAEDEEGKAKAITAGGDMVNDFTSWMTRVGQYQTKSMVELADQIRANFGQAASEQFKSSVAPALEEALHSLQQTREAISHAVAVLAGEEMGTPEPMGAEPGMDEFGGEEIPSTDDSMNADMGDEFAAADAAAGGAETAGRMRRESRHIFATKLSEGHMLMRTLSK
jgi:hypothetical protein